MILLLIDEWLKEKHEEQKRQQEVEKEPQTERKTYRVTALPIAFTFALCVQFVIGILLQRS